MNKLKFVSPLTEEQKTELEEIKGSGTGLTVFY